MEYKKRKSVSDSLRKYTFSTNDNDYITVTEWENEEGYDIDLNGKLFSLGAEELKAINYLVTTLYYTQDSDYESRD